MKITTLLPIIGGLLFGMIGTALLLCPLFCEEGDSILTLKEKCRSEGEEIHQNYLNVYKEYELCSPEYAYNPDSHTCLYYGCYTIEQSTTTVEIEGRLVSVSISGRTKYWVEDIFSNKEIISCKVIEQQANVLYLPPSCDLEDFKKQKQELFNQ